MTMIIFIVMKYVSMMTMKRKKQKKNSNLFLKEDYYESKALMIKGTEFKKLNRLELQEYKEENVKEKRKNKKTNKMMVKKNLEMEESTFSP